MIAGCKLGIKADTKTVVTGVRWEGGRAHEVGDPGLRTAHGVPSSLAEFKCDNALSFALPRKTALVYVDDTAWDVPTIEMLAKRLGEKLPKGAIVVHNSEGGYSDPTAFTKVGAVSVATSWDPQHTVHVHMTV